MLLLNAVYFALACLVLVGSGAMLVRSLSKVSRFLGISEFTGAFILMAFATSVPELFVGISSALSGVPSLSLGNVIGANILNLTLVAGIVVLVGKNLHTRSEQVSKDLNYMIGAIVLVIVLYIIGESISRLDGVILILFFSVNVYKKFQERKKYTAKLKSNIKKRAGIFNAIIFIVVLMTLFYSSQYVVKYASALAIELHLPQMLIGLFLLSIATTLPELVFGVSAIRLGHKEMVLGDQIGSVVANSTLILGIVAIISPISAEFLPVLTSAIFMFIAGFIFFTFAKTGKKIETLEGISLILVYVLFVVIEFFIK